MPSNRAAYLINPKQPLEVRDAPYPTPSDYEIVIKNGAVAINPLDWTKQDLGNFLFSWIKYPFVMGSDSAGEVVAVGPSVTRFKVGDRVLGHAVGMDEHFNKSSMGSFQTYTVLLEHMSSPIPTSLSYSEACVLPLGLSSAACGLFEDDQLALHLPSLSPKPKGKTLLIWGGASSVGSNAIQLAVAAGYEVITTCSPRNFDFVKRLGASQAFDYNSPTIISDITRFFQSSNKPTAGAFAIGPGSADPCFSIISQCNGDKFISLASFPLPSPPPKILPIPRIILSYLSWTVAWKLKTRLAGVKSKFIFGTTLVRNGVGKAMYEDFLPQALAESKYVAAPEPMVVGKGLEFIQEAMDVQKKGVSAKKVVVSL